MLGLWRQKPAALTGFEPRPNDNRRHPQRGYRLQVSLNEGFGGLRALPRGNRVFERLGQLLVHELEREAFVSLCGEPKSQERMQFMLMNNKPLRN